LLSRDYFGYHIKINSRLYSSIDQKNIRIKRKRSFVRPLRQLFVSREQLATYCILQRDTLR
jgi:hypothetical protein